MQLRKTQHWMEDAVKIEANAIKIVVITICLFPWPANASEKRDHAKMLCDTNLILCKHDCGKQANPALQPTR